MRFFIVVLAAMLAILASGLLTEADAAPNGPEASLQELKSGNDRFLLGKSTQCTTSITRRESLTKDQAPNAIILSCSDSRVPPEKVFDQDVGDLFVVRDAGNVLNPEVIASIEYAISHLGTHLIVVMGHDNCGAVQTALKTFKGTNAGSPSLNILVTNIQKNLEGKPIDPNDKNLRSPVKENVNAVAQALSKKSKIVQDAMAAGKVKIVRAIYGLETGKVDFWD